MFTVALVLAGIILLMVSGYGVAAMILAIIMLPMISNGLGKWFKYMKHVDSKIDQKLEEKLFGEDREEL